MLEQIGDIGLLRLGPGFDRFLAGAQLHRAAGKHLDLLAVRAQAVGHRATHPNGAVNITRRHSATGLQPGIKPAQHRCRLFTRPRISDHRQPVPAPENMHTHLVFDLRQIAVKLAAEADQQAIVRKFKDSFNNILGAGRGGQRADAQWGLLVSVRVKRGTHLDRRPVWGPGQVNSAGLALYLPSHATGM